MTNSINVTPKLSQNFVKSVVETITCYEAQKKETKKTLTAEHRVGAGMACNEQKKAEQNKIYSTQGQLWPAGSWALAVAVAVALAVWRREGQD